MKGAYYNEIDPYAAQWLRNLIAAGLIVPGDVDERSIEDVHPSDLKGYKQCHFFAGIGVWSYALRQARWEDDREVWTGSCPCQPFSAAGKGKGFTDERHLWPAWNHLIEQCRPSVVFGEQVASKDGLAWFDLVSSDLENSGYAVGATDICSAGVGAPHIRQRLYFVAERLGHAYKSRLEGWQRVECSDQRAFGSGGLAGRMADADGRLSGEARTERIQRSGEYRQQQENGLAGRMADSNKYGRESRPGHDKTAGYGHTVTAESHNDRIRSTGPTDGYWRDADWLFCRGEKWRPVESGTFPLADGTTARMGRLRAYGNAIVAPLAQAFIETYRDVTEEL